MSNATILELDIAGSLVYAVPFLSLTPPGGLVLRTGLEFGVDKPRCLVYVWGTTRLSRADSLSAEPPGAPRLPDVSPSWDHRWRVINLFTYATSLRPRLGEALPLRLARERREEEYATTPRSYVRKRRTPQSDRQRAQIGPLLDPASRGGVWISESADAISSAPRKLSGHWTQHCALAARSQMRRLYWCSIEGA